MMRRASLLLLSGLVLLGSCHEKLTEMLVVVSNEGLIVGDEIDAVDLILRGPTGAISHQQRVPLCVPGAPATTATCLYFPFSALLVPGEDQPGQPVEVQIDVLKDGNKVLANIAIFRFTKEKKLRLDVVLYPECFGNLSCAEQKKACIKNGQCADLTPMPLDPEGLPMQPDMSIAEPDLATPSVIEDMGRVVDFMPPPPDLTERDLIGCIPSCEGRNCGGNGCIGECGMCSTVSQCSGAGTCQACGGPFEPCCGPPKELCRNQLSCNSGNCEPQVDLRPPLTLCGGNLQPCCSSLMCNPGLTCNGATCMSSGFDLKMGSGSIQDMTVINPIIQDMTITTGDASASPGPAEPEGWGPF